MSAGMYAVYASGEHGATWTQVGVFDSVEEADRRAAEVVQQAHEPVDGAGKDGEGTRGGGKNVLDRPWECAEALVVEVPSRDEAPHELPLDGAVPIRSRFTRGADAPGPAMELSEENAFATSGQP